MDEIEAGNLVEKMADYSVENYVERLKEFLQVASGFQKKDWGVLWEALRSSDNDRLMLILWKECLQHVPDADKVKEYLQLLNDTAVMSWRQKYFLQFQITGQLFSAASLASRKSSELMWQIYHQILTDFKAELSGLEPVCDRNQSLVIVCVQQFLDLNHGPTKTTLDRARILKSRLGMNVIIVNTAELYGGEPVELFHCLDGSYISAYKDLEMIEYEGEHFPYIQFDKNMPNVSDAQEFIDFLKAHKPSYIVNIGGESLLADACAELVPVLNINTVPSGIARTEATMQVSGRKITPQDAELLRYVHKSEEDVMLGRFTSSLKKQEHQYTRQELGILEDGFVLAVVGARLTQEMTPEFIQMLDNVFVKAESQNQKPHDNAVTKIQVVIIGKMDHYEAVCQQDAIFRCHSVNLGLQDDVLAVLEQCDVYVNPDRTGGGTSVIEAMYKGLPAVTLRRGDVALGAGDEFCVSDYEQMQQVLDNYRTDKVVYNRMSAKARERAEFMLDSDTAFTEIIQKFKEKCNI
jgi:glycosyltransferase involved in cell wall biosynthesis